MKNKLTNVVLTAFDYEDEPGQEYLRLTFNVPQSDIKDVVSQRRFSLGNDYVVSGPGEDIDRASILKKHLKPGDLITHTRCLGVLGEHYFYRWDDKDVWICGKPTLDTVKCGGSDFETDKIHPLNVTYVNRVPVENLDFMEGWRNEKINTTRKS